MNATAKKRAFISLGAAILGLGLIPASAHANVVYMANGQPGYTDSGDWVAFSPTGYVGGGITYNGTTATWTPTTPLSGDYTIQVYYYADNSRPASAAYTVNNTTSGPATVSFDEQQRANQGAATNQIVDLSHTYASGWYTLGTFDLTSSSSVTLSHTGGSATANGVRFSNQDQIIDPLSASAVYSNFGNASDGVTGIFPTADDPNEQPSYVRTAGTNTSAKITYTPGLTGNRAVSISWVAGSLYTTAAQVVVDLDGNPATTGDITTINLNETQLNGGSTPGVDNTWSGWDSLGTLNLTAASTITYSFGPSNTGGELSIGSLLIGNETAAVPEPASIGLVMIGGLGLLSRRRRGQA